MSGGGGKGGTSSSTVSIPPEVLARYNAVNARAEQTAQQPFTAYSTDPSAFVAQLTPTQQAGIANTNAAAGAAQPWYQQAGGLAAASAQNVNPTQYSSGQIAQYMNPFAQQVIGGTLAPLQQQQAQDRAALQSQSIKAGAFGGDRAAIADAALRGQQEMATGNVVGGLLTPMYNQAQQEFNTQQQTNLAAQQANRQNYQTVAGLMGNLGAGAQSAALTGAQAQLSAGQQQQQTQQAGLTALYNQFLQQQSYPFQTTQFLANIAEGTGALSGSTTTGQQSGGFFSDERVKEDIEPIGETYDGQKIIKFRYKGDKGPKQIGLSAQDVEKHYPHAVGLWNGIKTVDYDEATKNSAHRGHFYAGGLASMGGAALDTGTRENFDIGGGVDQSALMAQLGLGRSVVNPYGSMGAAQSAVPTSRNIMTGSMSQPRGLMTSNLPARQPSGLSQAASFGKDISGLIGSKGTQDKSGQYSGGSGLAGLYQSGKDWLADTTKAHGGRTGFDDGGQVDDDQTDKFKPESDDLLKHQGKMVIPDDNPHAKLAAAQTSGSGGGGGGLGGLLGGAGSFMTGASKVLPLFGFADGGLAGREHHADGKTVGTQDTTVDTSTGDDTEHPALPLLRSREGFRQTPYFDVNAHRVGYGSDTVTAPDGTVSRVTPDTVVTRDDAERDLRRRVNETQAGIRGSVGDDAYNALSPQAQGALTSVAYNYGKLPNSVVAAIQSGDQGQIAAAVNALGVHNQGVNAGRRAQEANMIDPTGKYAPVSRDEIKAGAARAPLDTGMLGSLEKIPGLGAMLKSQEQGGLSDQGKMALLSGLGGMLASPNRTFLGALGSGITSGVETYQGMGGLGVQQQLANLKQQYAPAEAERVLAEAASKRAETQRASTAFTTYGVFKFGADGRTYTQKEYNDLEQQGKAPALLGYVPSDSDKRIKEKVGLPVTETNAAPAIQQTMPKKEETTPITVSSPSFDDKSKAAASSDDVTGQGPQAMASAKGLSDTYAANVQQNAQAARDTSIMIRDQINQLMKLKDEGAVKSGALFNFGAGATNLINSIGRQFGVENVAGNADATKQVLDKINTLSGSQLAAMGGQHAVEAMKRLIGASANPTMSPEAWSDILSTIGAQNMRSKDQDYHLSQWNKASNGYSQNAGRDFERLHPQPQYDAEKNAYQDLMLNNPAAFRALASGKFTAEQIDKKLESLYPGVKNMSRWFLGGF